MKFVMSGNLLRFANFQDMIEITAETVGKGIDALILSCPDLKPVLLDKNGQFRAVHRLFLNGDLLGNEDFDQPVDATDEVTILTAIAGG